jgi:hypothetical protein
MTAVIYPFTDQELKRLAAYRAAVAAGFYSEWPATAGRAGRSDGVGRGRAGRAGSRRSDTRLLARLLRPPTASGGSVPEYPFTEAELRRLETCRSAVAAGYYSEELSTDGEHPGAWAN